MSPEPARDLIAIMTMRPFSLSHCLVAALCALPISSVGAATGGEPAVAARIDVAPCVAAAAADDDDKVDAECPGVIDNDKTAKADRLVALIARGAHFARRGFTDRAIADDSRALELDPSSADLFNARGELWLTKGERPRAVQDFAAALRLDPNHEKAKANNRAVARELERIGAQMALAGKPSFDCARARRAVEKAICANRELADLDREIYGSHMRVVREAQSPAEARRLQREQDGFIAHRNTAFGRPGYDLKKAMQERLRQINGLDRY